MRDMIRRYAALLVTGGALTVAGCGGGHQATGNNPNANNATYAGTGAPAVAPADTMRARHHHSILAGAAAGAVAGHMAGHHALIGAATGALVQHERNKHGH